MKKILFSIIMFIFPVIIFASENKTLNIDINLDNTIATFNDVEYHILEKDKGSLEYTDTTKDYTYEFKMFDITDGKTELTKTDLIDLDKTYSFELTIINPKKNFKYNESNIFINYLELEKYNNVSIKISKGNIVLYSSFDYEEDTEENDTEDVVIQKYEVIQNNTEIVAVEENECLLGLDICCNEFNGISYCIVVPIGIVILLIIIGIIRIIIDKKDDKKYEEL